jgi:hypothetical protein
MRMPKDSGAEEGRASKGFSYGSAVSSLRLEPRFRSQEFPACS